MTRHHYLSWLCITLFMVAGCATTPPRDASLFEASARAIEQDLRWLADDDREGRATGTPGYAVAAQYVAARLAEAGLEVSLQPVTYSTAQLVEGSAQMILHQGDQRRELAWRDEFILGADASRAQTRVRAPLVFVGHGIRAPDVGHDDYAGVEARGRIVVMLPGAPGSFPVIERAVYGQGRAKAQAAAAAGAVGMITIRTINPGSRFTWEMIAARAGTNPSLSFVNADGTVGRHEPRIRGSALIPESVAGPLFEGARMSLAQVLEAIAAGEAVPGFELAYEAEIARHSEFDSISAPNVVGLLAGSDPALAHEYVVFSAHLDGLGIGRPVNDDTIYNGAYDNAMGVAQLIETARLYSAMETRPRRPILFVAVGAEERGLLGSEYFARHPGVTGKLVANINLDMPLFLFPLADLVAFGAELSTLGGVAERAAAAEGFKLSPDPFPEQVLFVRSDHYSFVLQGVPALFLITGTESTRRRVDGAAAWQDHMGNHYHRPSDDLDRPIHWPSAVRFAQVNARIGLEVANADKAPAWLPDNHFGRVFAAP